jgi:hypothetical protein
MSDISEERALAQKEREEHRTKYLQELENRSQNYKTFLKKQTNGSHTFTKNMEDDGTIRFPYDLEDEEEQFLLHMICAIGQKNGPQLSMVIETKPNSFNEEVDDPQIDLFSMTFCGTKIQPVDSGNFEKTHSSSIKKNTAYYRNVGLTGENTKHNQATPMTFKNLLSPCQIDAIRDHADKGMMPKSWATVVKAGEEEAISIAGVREYYDGDTKNVVYYANSQNNDSKHVTFAKVHDNLIATVNFDSKESLINVVEAQQKAHEILNNLNFKFNFCNTNGDLLTLKKDKTITVRFTFSGLKEALFALKVPIYSIAYRNADEELDAAEAEEEETSETLGLWNRLIENATKAPFDPDHGYLNVKPVMTNRFIDQVIIHKGYFESLCREPNPSKIFDFLIGDNGKKYPLMHQVAIFFSNSISRYAKQTKDQTGHLSVRKVEKTSPCYFKYLKRTKKHGIDALSSVGYELKVVDFFLRIIILAVYGKKVHETNPEEYGQITAYLTRYNEVFVENQGGDPLLSVQEILLLIPTATLKSIIRDFKNGSLKDSAMEDDWMKDNIKNIEETIESFDSSKIHPSSFRDEPHHRTINYVNGLPDVVASASGHTDYL